MRLNRRVWGNTFPSMVVAMLLAACLLIVTPPICTAGNNGSGTLADPYIVPETETDIKIDAALDEDAWAKALVLELDYEVWPEENTPAPVRTEVSLIHDESHLYAAFRCFDPDPSAIRARLTDRDHIGNNEDWVALILDTFNDQRRSFDFLVNPMGVQGDFIETESGGPSWDGIWDSAARITDWGYAVEMCIPFNQLRFQRTETPQVWGFDAVRRYPRSHVRHIGTFPRDRNNNCYLCQAIKIGGFEGVSPGRNIEISPTVTATRTDVRPDFPEGDFEVEREEADAGVTAGWGITPNMTVLGTVNPDFSHVEADAFQLDINRPFALFYSEKRPFFTEGGDFFSTLKSAVYTRTVRDPVWGVKASGKERGNAVGAFVVRDDLTNLIFPGSQDSDAASLDTESTASVIRYRRDMGRRSTIGALLTNREAHGYFNRLLGLDCDLRLTATDQVQLQLMASSTKYTEEVVQEYEQPEDTFTDEFIAFEYDHSSRNVYWWLDYDEVGSGFRADLGFIPRVGYRNVEGGIYYTWNPDESGWWSRAQAGAEYNHYETLGGSLLDQGGTLWATYEGALQSQARVAGYRYREAFKGVEFEKTYYRVSGGMGPTRDLWFDLSADFGDHIDYDNTRLGDRLLVGVTIDYNLKRRLNIGVSRTYEHLDVSGGRLYTANVSELTLMYHINVRTFIRSILQYADYDFEPGLYIFEIAPGYKQLFTQILFSYKLNPRTVFYLGYTDDHFGDNKVSLTQANRTFFTKLGYAWVR